MNAETVFWFLAFWVVLPGLAYTGWGGWPLAGWLGVGLLLLCYLAAVLLVRVIVSGVRDVMRGRVE